ncbi:MAG: PHP domain-containing protein [Planctomycetota bacterium]
MSTWHRPQRRFVDLHAHSTASDGSLSPRDLIELADEIDLAAIALTDHDTTDGIAEARQAAAGFPDLRFSAGVEISAEPPSGTLHIVGLGIDESAPSILHVTQSLRDGRDHRNPRIVDKLRALGLEISMADVLAVVAEAGGDQVVSRVHIAEALRRLGLVQDRQEAFDRYLATGQLAYVDRVRFSPADSITAIHEAGGLAFVAHPPQLHYDNHAQFERIVRQLMAAGLDGIEAYHSDCTSEQTRHYINLAKRFDLHVMGGSDFHGSPKPDVSLGHPHVPAGMISDELAERLFS